MVSSSVSARNRPQLSLMIINLLKNSFSFVTFCQLLTSWTTENYPCTFRARIGNLVHIFETIKAESDGVLLVVRVEVRCNASIHSQQVPHTNILAGVSIPSHANSFDDFNRFTEARIIWMCRFHLIKETLYTKLTLTCCLTHAIKTLSLYIFYPIFHCGLYC